MSDLTPQEGMELGRQFMLERSPERRRNILVLAVHGMPGMSLRAENSPKSGTPEPTDRCPGQCGRRVSPGRMCLSCKTTSLAA